MKKTIYVFLIVILFSLSLFAESEWTGNNTSGSASMNITFTDETGFKDSSSEEHGFVVFGFTNSNAIENIITPTDSLVLSETFDGNGNATASGLIYGFVRVASRTKMKFSLNWESFNKETTSPIALTVNGNGSGYVFYTFDPATDVMIDERIPLFISTENYTNSLVVGSFSTVINMKVESII